MPVPDHVIFGPDNSSGRFTYGEVRAMAQFDQHHALKGRMDTFFIAQVKELAKSDDDSRKVYAPFPLFLLTCVGIETLGKVLYRPKKMNDEDAQREGFLEVTGKFGQKFSRPLSKQDKKNYDVLWGDDEHKKVKSIAHLIYRFGRHTMVHGFRGKGVYLTEGIPDWESSDGAITLNPYWFWSTFKETYDNSWKEFFASKEPTCALKRSANQYLDELLK